MINNIKFAICSLLSTAVYFLGGSDILLKVLIIFIVLDYTTGITAAVYTKSLNSQVGFKGILKKLTILTVVALSHWAGVITGTELIRTVVISFYVANEGISIIENAVRCNVPVPEKLRDVLQQLKDE